MLVMTQIKNILEQKCRESVEIAMQGLFSLLSHIETPIENHLSQINHQLPGFDIHNISHSHKMLENIEKIMDRSHLESLSAYELFLIYTSCLLHDCGMAMPEWEHNLLKFCEGNPDIYDESLRANFYLDGKPPLRVSEMKKLIRDNRNILYGETDEWSSFIFAPDNEEELLNDLSERAIEYQNYRNGFIDILNSKVESRTSYLLESSEIRYRFIRETHSRRVAKYIRALGRTFSNFLGGNWGTSLAKELATICVSHGEDYSFVLAQKEDARFFGSCSVNIQFVCTLLRLADILHFSYDRAPISFFAEKMISEKESRMHWKVKMQGVSYDIVDINNTIKIVFNAYCEEPDYYYFLKEYIGFIEVEIQNYNKFIRSFKQRYDEETSLKYTITFQDSVDAKGVTFDADSFVPVENLGFSIDQKEIIKLLMGTNLYKDVYSCLRELYQNALDACRCMQGFDNVEGKIEFGLDSEFVDGKHRKYVYCLDNGAGMSKDIILNHFLKIGKSFYKSKEFNRQHIAAGSKYTPVSQFGIGVLSCYMIGDRIDVTTKYVNDQEVIRFVMNGPHEHFYYANPLKSDLEERLSKHGTLIKIFLKDDFKLDNKFIDEKSMFRSIAYNLKEAKCQLLYLLINYINIVPDKFGLFVNTSDKKAIDVKAYIENLSVSLLSDDEYNNYLERYVEALDRNDDTLLPQITSYQKTKSDIEFIEIKLQLFDIEYYSYLCLPKSHVACCGKDDLMIHHINNGIIDGKFLIDGISVDDWELVKNIFNKTNYLGIPTPFSLNCCGKNRPLLSVDRTQAIHVDDELSEKLETLIVFVLKEEIDYIANYIRDKNILWDSHLASEIWNYFFKKWRRYFPYLIKAIIDSKAKIYLSCILKITKENDLKKLLQSRSIKLGRINEVLNNDFVTALINCIAYNAKNISLVGREIEVEFDESMYCYCSSDRSNYFRLYTEGFDFCSPYQSASGDLKHYDLITSCFPFIPENIFEKIRNNGQRLFNGTIDSEKAKEVALSAFSLFGCYRLTPRSFDPESMVINWPNKRGEFSGLTFWGKTDDLKKHEENMDYLFYVYISPDELSESEGEIDLCKESISEHAYANCEGISVLFLGSTKEIVALPGIVSKSELLKQIPLEFWDKYSEKKFLLTDDTVVNREYLQKL